MADNNRSLDGLLAINRDPAEYDPQPGDVLEWCDHIRIEVDHVTPDGKVAIRDIPPGGDADARVYLDGERPDPDPNKHPPLGIKTWASENQTVAVEDLQRLLRHGWELTLTR